MTFKILSLDGGGIRGVLSARLLEEVETAIKETKGQELHEYFDLVTGTSTGSILTAAIACQMNAQEMIDVYLEDGKNIFLDSVRKQRKWRMFSQAMGSNRLYPHEQGEQGLTKILQKKLIHPELGSPKISQIVKPYILIPAYDVYSRNTTWFANNPADSGAWYDNIDLWKICTASASAPTFFPPYELPYNDEESLPHIDGGVSANNPTLIAIAHALLIEKQNGLQLKDIAVLSIGTGDTTCPYSYEEIKKWGLLGWAKHLPDMFLNPGAQNSEVICEQILDSVGGDILRLDFDLNNRFEGDKRPGRLRPLLDKPYNQYILKQKNKYTEISEDIDNPENCPKLIEAAECYLDCGEVYYKNKQGFSVREAIREFIKAHSPYESSKDN
ncbi:patatin-like phospholipase family protein [Roseofilum sp. Belize Diploria]|uniref:patatin-like phospholipase family protein n=1 Tax=Roseofilum sp. Belize Diploria TaxID=2821501 RepID=UPI000E86241C|nr:patatin-like phospholipase family protein [Roseofilum sp. Belize Diploria]MBP0009259.1 patatin-like phospholipase family protein [Roseofilum sp. Belize Diploria]HBQ99198.1 patatin [Cyanobacteria bacterium UBA11691]